MGRFVYKAVDKNGVVVKAEIEGEDLTQVRKDLDMAGLIAVDIKRASIFNTDVSNLSVFGIGRKRLSKKDIAFVCRQIAFVLRSGLSVDAGFNVIIDNAPNQGIKKCFSGMKAGFMRGEGVAACFKKAGVFPAFLCSMINVGELTDSLDIIMKSMADFYENDARISSQIAASMLYPVFVAAAMAVVLIGALVFVVPGYSSAFSDVGAALPLPTRIMIGMSNFMVVNWKAGLVSVSAIAIAVCIFFSTPSGRYIGDLLRLRNIFTGSFNTKSANLYFAASMSVLLASGTDMISSLETAKEILGSAVFGKIIDRMVEMIRGGSKLSAAADGFCGMLRSMIALGEETDKLPETLNECAKYLEDDLDSTVNKLKNLIQPVSTIVLGLILAFIVLATMLPTIQMTSFY